MLSLLTKGTQVWEKGSAPALPWRVVGQGRHGVICRRSEGSNVMTRCFKPDELQRADEPAREVARNGYAEADRIEQPCVG
jgi:hypothetical protein